MVALNFKAQFADDVEDGRKRRSIRAPRKDGRDPKKGDRLQLYTGMRQKGCRKLGDSLCVRIRSVEIDHMGIKLDGRQLYAGDAPAYQGGPDPERYEGDFARADGFDSFPEMVEFFEREHGLPFKGNLIEWSAAPIIANSQKDAAR
jgi:hypothetical protein